MTQEMIIKKNEVDYKEMIALALNKQDWGKKYNLYTLGSLKIDCTMYEMNFEYSKATFLLNLEYESQGDIETCIGLTYFHINNFDIEQFKNLVNKKILSMINEIIDRETCNIARQKYSGLYFDRSDCREKNIIEECKLTKDHESILEIVNDDIQQDSLDVLFEKVHKIKNKEYHKKVKAYCKTNKVNLKYVNSILDCVQKEIDSFKVEDEN